MSKKRGRVKAKRVKAGMGYAMASIFGVSDWAFATEAEVRGILRQFTPRLIEQSEIRVVRVRISEVPQRKATKR